MSDKKTLTAIVAHPIPSTQLHIARVLGTGGRFTVVHTTSDGLDCLQAALSLQPDLVVLDMVLEKIDGLEVLRRLKGFALPQLKTLITTCFDGNLSEYALMSGADYCLLAPFEDDILLQRAIQLVTPPQANYSEADIRRETARVLAAISAPTHLVGYGFVLDSVVVLIRNPDVIRRRKAVDGLYNTVAGHNNATFKQVERSLRTFTSHIWTRSRLATLERYFDQADIARGHIANTAFLSVIASHVSANLRAQPQVACQGH